MRGVVIGIVLAGTLGISVLLHSYVQDTGSRSQSSSGFISLSPGLTETLFALGAGDAVKGVTQFCLYPPEAQERVSVGGLLDPNYEALVALNPQLIFMTPYHRDLRREMRRLGLSYEIVPQDTLPEIRESFLHVGVLCGHEEEGRKLVAALDRHMSAVSELVRDREKMRVLLVTGRNEHSGSLQEVYAVSTGSFLSDLLEIAGAENCVAGAVAEYPALSVEGILHLDPEYIIELVEKDPQTALPKLMAPWQALSELQAVQNSRVKILGGSHFTIPGPRITQVLDAFVAALHPDLKECVL
ncbi:MAG TPA: ABC transporter substrate-binding protein [Candidatus Hydrogenedentes bacterium]|nr:ABC transporter substrate-binding protein [Candidatus Hydrogenedentota bacterium]HOR51048.1 ABC transporter substrate-binding protein [Candidatus Hydrogenedentota bacterium]HPK24963.1 ABC transporter substrate-binding protein [Candidatus Hydrogenedentota bacterium]HPX86497.1 ABC transporter substrate-binding protein [Candidatus Hydrogenedentota bacterium]HQB03354.1 ABC transporter substrate-binding protein [Candidatus Hydrogenedentota bacterium]